MYSFFILLCNYRGFFNRHSKLLYMLLLAGNKHHLRWLIINIMWTILVETVPVTHSFTVYSLLECLQKTRVTSTSCCSKLHGWALQNGENVGNLIIVLILNNRVYTRICTFIWHYDFPYYNLFKSPSFASYACHSTL